MAAVPPVNRKFTHARAQLPMDTINADLRRQGLRTLRRCFVRWRHRVRGFFGSQSHTPAPMSQFSATHFRTLDNLRAGNVRVRVCVYVCFNILSGIYQTKCETIIHCV